MLVLTRKYQEKIRIGNNITITVLRMKGKAVRLGIEAPAEVPVIRGELSFNGARESADASETEAPVIECELERDDAPRNGRIFGRMAESTTHWPANASATREPEPTVEFTRIPRDKVAKLLPKMAAGQPPLRAMMSQGTRG
jgi:carbon storage regulator